MATIFGTPLGDTIATTVEGGAGLLALSSFNSDVVFGDEGNDTILGGSGNLMPSMYFGSGGNDSIRASFGANTVLFGEAGDDTLTAAGLNQTLNGGDGNDWLNGGVAAGLLIGGNGQDTIIAGGNIDTILGGNGADSISATGGDESGGYLIDGGHGNNTISAGEGNDRIDAGGNDDSILGNGGNDRIDAGGGNNTVAAGAGNDTILADNGADSITGDDPLDTLGGSDLIYAGDGNNTVSGGAGNDSIYAGFGNDSILGGDGNDFIDAGDGNNTVSGGNGDDYIITTFGNDFLTGGDGNDRLEAGSGNNTVSGGNGDDNIFAAFGADSILGGGGNDQIYAGSGNNTLSGGSGNDNILAAFGADSMSGGDGDDNLIADGANDTLFGDAGNDTLDGGDGTDTLNGGAGNDRILAGGSSDLIIGSTGNDLIDGGDGFDTLDYSQLISTARVTITLSGAFFRAVKLDGTTMLGSDFLSNAVEAFIGTANNDRFIGWDQDETFTGGAGNDFINGGAGSDTARYDVAGVGSVVANLLTGIVQDGQGGTDTLRRIGTDNTIENIITGDAADTLIGDSDNNSLRGRGGADYIDGGAGSDMADYNTDAVFNSTIPGISGVLVNLSADVIGGVAGGRARDAGGAMDTLIGIENVRGTELADTLIGSDADGNLFRGNRGADVIDGRMGNDTADHRNDADGASSLPGTSDFFGVIVNLSNSAVTIPGFGAETNVAVGASQARDGWGDIDTLTSIESAIGTGFNDLLIGTQRVANFTVGGISFSGTDRSFLRGRQGNDTIQAVADSDGVIASYFDDQAGIIAELNLGSTIEDGFGNIDTLINVDGVQGSNFDDLIVAGSTGSWIRGRAGDDTLIGGSGTDVLNYGSAAAGVMVNLRTGMALDGDGGTDSLGGSFELLNGSAFADTLIGGDSAVVFSGGAGADSIVGGASLADMINYYTAWQTAGSTMTGGVLVNLTAQVARDGDGTPGGGSLDRLVSIEHAVGSHLNDTLLGSAGANTLVGAEGADTISGQAGNDLLDGGTGADTLNGGLGADTMIGGGGNDLFVVDTPLDVVIELLGGGADTVQSAVSYNFAVGADIEVLVLTGGANLAANGNAIANMIIGNGGANRINGGAGQDTLSGGLGADTLFGGMDADSLMGGGGADHFLFDRIVESRGTTAIDAIADFEVGVDKITFQDDVGRFVMATQITAINLDVARVVATADTLAAVYAGIGAIAASTATLQMVQIDVTAGARAGSYLFVNDGAGAVSSATDMLLALSFAGGPTALTAGDLGLF